MHETPKNQSTPLPAPAAGLASRARGRIAAMAIALTAAAWPAYLAYDHASYIRERDARIAKLIEEARTAPRIDRYATDEHGCELDKPCYMVEVAGDNITVTGELFFPVVMR